MKKRILLFGLIICLLFFLTCTDNRPIGTFVVQPEYYPQITFTITDDGKVKFEQGRNIDYGSIGNYRDGYCIDFKYAPETGLGGGSYLFIKDGYIYGDVDDFIAEHPTRRLEFKKR